MTFQHEGIEAAPLGELGERLLIDRLNEIGLSGLASSVALTRGSVHGLVPCGTPKERALQIDVGECIDSDQADRALLAFITRASAAEGPRWIVVVDPYNSGNDYEENFVSEHQVDFRNGLHGIRSDVWSDKLLRNVLGKLISFDYAGIVTETEPESIIRMDRTTSHVFLSAYDAESYLVWSRHDQFHQQPR